MNVLRELRARFQRALEGLTDERAELIEMVRPSQDPKFGDYQANCAMPLGKRLGRSPRDVAAEIVARLEVGDMCEPPSIAGPGFINLRLRDDWVAGQLARMLASPRLDVEATPNSETIVVDYSAPNVAKEMHVGHIRSTVIGDCLCRILRFVGHRVIGDNHVGDWGTQFGMIIYGFRHFVDRAAYEARPVEELARLYKLVNRLVSYREWQAELPRLEAESAARCEALAEFDAACPPADQAAAKEHARRRRKLVESQSAAQAALADAEEEIAAVQRDQVLAALAERHPAIATDVLAETARLHEGDPESLALWRAFLPACLNDIQRIYERLGVAFDVTLGESFYHDRLRAVVDDLLAKGLARESDGAICVFLEGYAAPFIVRKQDGAFLYSTTDLATIQYRVEVLHAHRALYVVDHRQSLHFEQLFEVARRWGYRGIRLVHVSFGTVLGDDGRPFKTRSGDTVALAGLLDEAVRRAYEIVAAGDDAKPQGPELSGDERTRVAEVVGIAALKYADLAQNRTSDYVFSYDKMLAMNGNTATYMQYAYARVRSIFAKGQVDQAELAQCRAPFELSTQAERALAVELVRLPEAIDETLADYRPNQLTGYLFALANRYSTFFEACPVLKAESESLRNSRLRLCDLTARTIKLGLALLGIEVVERM